MTIDELLAATGLTANDLVPIYDAEAAQNVEPTQKITAAQLAAAVKVLASLVNTTEMNAAIQQSTASALDSMQIALAEKNVTIPANAVFTIDLSEYVPSGKAIYCVAGARLGSWILPYGNNETRITRLSGATLTIDNNTSEWTNTAFYAVVFIR